MRKLAVAALAAAALFAQGVRAQQASEERKEAADATKKEMKQDAREAKGEAKEAGREAKAEAKEAGREVKQGTERAADKAKGAWGNENPRSEMNRDARTAQSGQRGEEKKHPLFDGKDNFEMKGKVQKVSQNSITLQREELPAATLRISKNTKIELDGEQASAQQLKAGQDVQASFNLQGDKPEAVEIKAEKKSQ